MKKKFAIAVAVLALLGASIYVWRETDAVDVVQDTIEDLVASPEESTDEAMLEERPSPFELDPDYKVIYGPKPYAFDVPNPGDETAIAYVEDGRKVYVQTFINGKVVHTAEIVGADSVYFNLLGLENDDFSVWIPRYAIDRNHVYAFSDDSEPYFEMVVLPQADRATFTVNTFIGDTCWSAADKNHSYNGDEIARPEDCAF